MDECAAGVVRGGAQRQAKDCGFHRLRVDSRDIRGHRRGVLLTQCPKKVNFGGGGSLHEFRLHVEQVRSSANDVDIAALAYVPPNRYRWQFSHRSWAFERGTLLRSLA